jgi:RNA polymerase sigma factor (sigma-70 family)
MLLSKSQAASVRVGADPRLCPPRGRPQEDAPPDGRSHAAGMTAADLHARYLKDVFRYVLQRVSSIDEAEDITAEVFAAAAAGLSSFRGQCPPYLWLLSIARRQIARAQRRRAVRRETLASELAGEGPGRPCESGPARRPCRRCAASIRGSVRRCCKRCAAAIPGWERCRQTTMGRSSRPNSAWRSSISLAHPPRALSTCCWRIWTSFWEARSGEAARASTIAQSKIFVK